MGIHLCAFKSTYAGVMGTRGAEERLEAIAALVDPVRVRRARDATGLTQGEMAARVAEVAGHEISSAALSQIERGLTRPSAETLRGIASATGYPPAFFLRRGDDTIEGDASAPTFFRSLRSASSRDRRGALAQAFLVHDLVVAIEAKVRLPELDLPMSVIDGEVDPAISADRVRRRWGLNDDPLENVVRILEQHGIVVARLTTGLSKVDGFSVAFKDRPVVVLGNDKGKRDRSRFDASHELGHLVMHRSGIGDLREAESQAHAFAAAFLMPERTIKPELREARLSWNRLLELKLRWGVSIAALIRRARDLQVISSDQYTNYMKALSARGWRIDEPGDAEQGSPEASRMLEAALDILERQGLSLRELSDTAGLPVKQVEELVVASIDPRPRLKL